MDDGDREGDATCEGCGATFADAPGSAGLCEPCRARRYPPIGERGPRWGPLAMGIAAVLCDPIGIPSFMAIRRGVDELKEVATRESEGLFATDHPKVRADAVLGIVLGATRPVVFLGIFLCSLLGDRLEPPSGSIPELTLGPESAEILERFEHGDEDDRRIASGHVAEIADTLSAAEIANLVRALDARFAEAEPERTQGSRMLVALLGARAHAAGHGPAIERATLERLFRRADARGRSAILAHLARQRTEESYAAMVGLAAEATAPDDAEDLPTLLLAESADRAHLFLPGLLALPAEHPMRGRALTLAAELCDAGMDPSALDAARDRLLGDWAAILSRIDAAPSRVLPMALRPREADPTTLVQLRVLRCVDGADALAALSEVARREQGALAITAVDGLWRRDAEIGPEIVERLAADVKSRPELWALFVRHHASDAFPAEHASREARASALAQRNLPSSFDPPTLVATEERELGGAPVAYLVLVSRGPVPPGLQLWRTARPTLVHVVGPFATGDEPAADEGARASSALAFDETLESIEATAHRLVGSAFDRDSLEAAR